MTIWKDIINDNEVWVGLRLEVEESTSPQLQLVSGNNCRFKLCNGEKPLLWGTFGKEYWGAWILLNKVEWELSEMPVIPISSTIIEKSRNENFYSFWSRFFAKQLSHENSCLSNGTWTLTIGSLFKEKEEHTSEIVEDIEDAFINKNPRWVEWDIGRCGSLVALKEAPTEDSGRVKWYRKLVREVSCPPVLVWFLNCLDGFVILDGHARLKAFQLESVAPTFLVLNSIVEYHFKKDPKMQQNVLQGIEKRQQHAHKSKMTTEAINKLLINAFDTRPYCRKVTSAKARHNFETTWLNEVREIGQKLALNIQDVEEMIQRMEV